MHILLDANILIRDPWLKGKWLSQLLEFAERHDAVILLMQLVEIEVRGRFTQQLDDKIEDLKRSLKNAERFNIQGLPKIGSVSIRRDTLQLWKEQFSKFCEHQCIRKIPLENPLIETVVNRYTSRIRPCPPNAADKGGIKDTIIWMMLLNEAKTDNNIRNVALITNDGDFRDGDKIHPDLAIEAEEFFKIQLYTTIKDFLKDNAHKPSHISLEWINDHLEAQYVIQFLTTFFNNFSDLSYFIEYKIIDSYLSEKYKPSHVPEIITSIEYKVQRSPTKYEENLFYLGCDVRVMAEVECTLVSYNDELELPEYRTLTCEAREEVNLVLQIESDLLKLSTHIFEHLNHKLCRKLGKVSNLVPLLGKISSK